MKHLKSKKAIVLLVLAIAAIATVGAYAYWTTTGAGTGTGTAGTNVALTVNQTSSGATLYPGNSVPLSGNFTNGATYAQYVTSVTASIDAFSVQPNAAKPACTEADFTLTSPTVAVGQDINPGAANGSWSGITLNMLDTAANQDNCKNVTVPLSYSSN